MLKQLNGDDRTGLVFNKKTSEKLRYWLKNRVKRIEKLMPKGFTWQSHNLRTTCITDLLTAGKKLHDV
tara:strand:+ start:1032 stop:1235 length:204 start_codon:yes stop_codon:yes gene_type:complete